MTEPAGHITRLYTECAAEAADEVANLFQSETNRTSVVELVPDPDDDPDKPLTFDRAAVSVYLEPTHATESLQSMLDLKLRLLAQLAKIGTLQRQEIGREDWEESWKKHYRPMRVGKKLVVCPSWHEYHPSAGELVLSLDPGMAFGTGIHPSTQMCLSRLETSVRPGDKVLDVGAGSGILTLAALGLGASRVVAIDVDPVAVETTNANIERAGLEVRVESILADFKHVVWDRLPTDFKPPYDIVTANLTAGIILANLDNLLEPMMPGGVLIASGIIVQREEEMSAALSTTGIAISERQEQGDWLCLVIRKPK